MQPITLDHALQRGLNFIDAAQMHPVLPSAVRCGKVRQVGLSGETPWGVAEFLRVAGTIIGVPSLEPLDEDLDARDTPLSPELLAQIDRIRREMRDPAQ
jgi:aryl-alcohol dehydrogenase-like predicted oxidoreductase